MKIKNAVVAGFFALGLANAQAELFDRGGGLIYDKTLNITWLQDPSLAISHSIYFDSASYVIDQFVFLDPLRNTNWSDWRITRSSELQHLFHDYGIHSGSTGPFVNVQTNYPQNPNSAYWGISYDYNWNPPLPFSALFEFNTGSGNPLASNAAPLYAWAVRDGDVGVAPVPEPETYAMLLAGLGLLGVTARRRRQKLNA